MDKVRKWFGSRKLGGSTETLNQKQISDSSLAQLQPDSKTTYELTSMKIKHLLEKRKFQKVVDTLRELSHVHILKCLESFPFKALNKHVPESFPIWETLLTKLHNSEEGYIPQFPYMACDQLVLQVAWLLEMCTTNGEGYSEKSPDLILSSKRVLKCVYMQYNEVFERLYKEHDKVEHALYTLGLHLPLGTDFRTALTIKQAIEEEVNACLADYTNAMERLDEFTEKEVLSLTEMLMEKKKGTDENSDEEADAGLSMKQFDFYQAPNPTQVQLHERLYQNQCVLTTLQPSRRTDTLPQLLEILDERIRGDKEVLAIFGRIRMWNDGLSDSEPVEPWLRKYQHAVELVIGIFKEIERELEITIPKAESPVQLQLRSLSREGTQMNNVLPVEDGPQIVRPRSMTYDNERSPSARRRHSASPGLSNYLLEEEMEPLDLAAGSKLNELPRRYLSIPYMRRPRSTSPHKILRVNGSNGITNGGLPTHMDSMKSVNSSNGSSTNLANGASSSVHDLHSTKENQPSLAFTRVQSLKTHHSVQVVAGKRKMGLGYLPKSLTNLSSFSTGNVNGGKKAKKSLYRSGSGGLGHPGWDRQMSGEGMSPNQFMLQHELEYKNKELLQAKEIIQELRKRERELTDRLSEQAQRHLQDSEKFEDILLGTSRPTLVVQRYQELYSQERVEAVEAVEAALNMEGKTRTNGSTIVNTSSSFRIQLVMDVLKFAYMVAGSSLEQLHSSWRDTLDVESEDRDTVAVKQLESAVGLYLKRKCSKHDVSSIIETVNEQLAEKYTEVFEKVKTVESFCTYVVECCKVSWDLSVQTPPMVINFSEMEYNFDLHTRFYDSDKDSAQILMYHWPTLLQTASGPILFRGVVQT